MLTETSMSMPAALQLAHLVQRRTQHELGDQPDHPGVLGERDELVRGDRARGSGATSVRGPRPRSRRRSRGRSWLVDRNISSRSTALRRSVSSSRRRGVCVSFSGRYVRTRARSRLASYIATSARFMIVKTSVPCMRRERDAGARLDAEPDVADVERLRQGRAASRRRAARPRSRPPTLGDQDGELVAAQPGHGRRLGHALPRAGGRPR